MATQRKKKPKAPKEPNAHRDLLQRIRDRYHVMVEADQENRRKAMDDLRFVNEPGAQWDANMKKERGDRPCYEFNKLRINGKRVINEIRANRPQGKVRAVEGGDKKTAELYEGLCRNIANMSDLDTITDNAAEYQVDAGMACWRVVTKYAADDVFDQDILVEGIKNPFNLWVDPGCKDPLKRDAEDWILEDRISKEAYAAKYKGKEVTSFEGDTENGFDDEDDWSDEHTVRIVEYWYKEPYEKYIWLVSWPQPDGTTKTKSVDSTTDEAPLVEADIKAGKAKLVKSRLAKCQRIMMCVASGDALLEEPQARPGSVFPFVMVFGETKVIEGKVLWWGLHRFAKDAQQSYNISRTSIDETIAMAPKEFFWATPEQAAGHTNHWAEAHRKNFPYKLYNADLKAPGAPPKVGGAQVPVALIEQSMISAQDIRDVTGLHEASFGEESGEKSGVALARKQNQAQIVTYNFPDNMAKGVKRTWEILIDYIPHVYDAERELRVLGADGAEDYQKVNQLVFDPQQGKTIRVNDVTTGKYDVTITTGPSFSTMRQEAAEIYGEIGSKSPELMQVAGDLVFKAMDLPYADEIAKRWQAILPPPIQQMLNEGKDLPPEAQAAMAQAAQAMQRVQEQTALVQQAAQEVQQDQAKSVQAKANVEKVIADLKVERAQFEAEIAKKMSALAIKEAAIDQNLATRESDLQQRETTYKADKERDARDNSELSETRQAIKDMDALLAQYIESAAQAMSQIKGEVTKPKRRLKGAKTRREGANLFADIEFDDGTTDSFQASRQGGNLVAVPVAAPTQPIQ